mgnify:CR=1 FL=1
MKTISSTNYEMRLNKIAIYCLFSFKQLFRWETYNHCRYLSMITCLLFCGNIIKSYAEEGDELYNSGAFNTGSNVSYTMNGTLTKSSKTWTMSSYQINSSVFYLGCNSTHAAKGVLAGTGDNNPNKSGAWNDVIAALKSASSWYNTNSSTGHAYAMSMSSTYSNVGKITVSWSGASGPGIAYLFANKGSGLELLISSSVKNGASESGSLEYSNTDPGGINISKVVFVYRGGSSESAGSTNKTIRITSIVIKEGKAASSCTNKVTISKGGETNGSFSLSRHKSFFV